MEASIKAVLIYTIQQLKAVPGISSLLIQGDIVITINDDVCFDIIFSKEKENSFQLYQKNLDRSSPVVDNILIKQEQISEWQNVQGTDSMKERTCMDCTCNRAKCRAANREHIVSEASSEGFPKVFVGPTQTILPVHSCNNLQKQELLLPSQHSLPNKKTELTTVRRENSSQNYSGAGKTDGYRKGKEEIPIKSKTSIQEILPSELSSTRRQFKRRKIQSRSPETSETSLTFDHSQVSSKTLSSNNNNMGSLTEQTNRFDGCSFENSSMKDEDEIAVPHKLSSTDSRKSYFPSKNVTFNRRIKQKVQCEVCGKWLASLDSLKEHQRGLHHDIKPYKCKECGQAFRFRHSYKVHMQKHTGLRPFQCSQCNTTYLTASHLKTHTISQHSGKGREPQFQCETCGRAFLWASSLKTHQLTHADVRPFQCVICSRGFTTKQALTFHTQSHHEKERKFECDVCHKFYKSDHLRNLHKQRHIKVDCRRFVCDTCGQRFLFRSNLEAHKHVHGEERPHVCKACGKCFKLKTSLHTHQYTHSQDTPFECSICSKAFKTKSCCKAHERRHKATRAFLCTACRASFPDKGGLSKHERTVHRPTRLFLCTICGKQGTRKDNMRTHLKSHWREVQVDNPEDFIQETSTEDG